MENNKEVQNILDDPKQHPIEAPPHQGYPHEDSFAPADNPLQPPKLQQLPAGGSVNGGEEEKRNASTEMGKASGGKFEEWSWALTGLCMAAIMVVTCCCCCGKAC
ncbi:unnamed protein product [Microthlaspi erraticum]|uniref:Uncharacterized protein n=1 Tax=Microthlaspi erraticum TaxID=1685480 RepID=A0A6D2II79_9BRAS|nr:unnamed protein product [Microthlaspi erraticum]